MDRKLKISKNNAMVAASYRFTLTEVQIILYGIGLINPLSENFPLVYQIKIKEFAELFGRDHQQIYGEVKEAVFKKFWERDFSYIGEDGEVVTNRWLTRIRHKDDTGFIEIKFSEEIRPYLHQLKDNFTSYYIEQIAKFKSFYSVRFYEFSILHLNRSRTNQCTFTESIESLKRSLVLEDKYKRFYDIKARVVEKAKKEINKYSDITLSYEVIKLGRIPKEIKFTVKRKQTEKEPVRIMERKTVSTTAIEQAKKLAMQAGTGWDIYAIEQQFYDFIKRKGPPDNLEGAFIGFVKNKITKTP